MNVSVPGLFRCTRCGNLDVLDKVYPNGCEESANGLTCTVCHGHPWHDQFPQQAYDPDKHEVVNPPGSGPMMDLSA